MIETFRIQPRANSVYISLVYKTKPLVPWSFDDFVNPSSLWPECVKS